MTVLVFVVVGLLLGLVPEIFPLGLVAPVFGMYALIAILTVWYADRLVVLEARGDRCKQCGYNLTGNVSGVCPECGTEV